MHEPEVMYNVYVGTSEELRSHGHPDSSSAHAVAQTGDTVAEVVDGRTQQTWTAYRPKPKVVVEFDPEYLSSTVDGPFGRGAQMRAVMETFSGRIERGETEGVYESHVGAVAWFKVEGV